LDINTKMVKRPKRRDNLFKAISSLIFLSIIIIAISAYFINKENLIGTAFLALGILNLIILKSLRINIAEIYPDMIFGFVDNGVLVFTAIIGGAYAGVFGAIIGGAAGNTITDGIGGLFEGYVAEHQRKMKINTKRTTLSASLGKMAGCLFGAGMGLLIIQLIQFIF
jgi:hypothetical protein